MKNQFFKYKSISVNAEDDPDERSISMVLQPIIDSYFYLPTRRMLNDPNEGVFQNQLEFGIRSYLQGVTGFGERIELTTSLYGLARQISQSTDNSGIFSLSKSPEDELMWAHYGASHRGILIEYDLKLLTRFSSNQHLHCFDVKYSQHPPVLDMHNLQDPAAAVRRMLGHKSPRWNYEEEYRIVLENINGIVPHDYRAIKSITFGARVPKKTRAAIYEMTLHKVPQYYEICITPNMYTLERRLLDNFQGKIPTGSALIIDLQQYFTSLTQSEKASVLCKAQQEIYNDPHFKELLLAERSNDPNKAVVQYEVQHEITLEPFAKYTNHYYDL